MDKQSKSLRWGAEQRLEFIEFRLYWEGGINRADLVDFFGVSVPQASNDLSQYQELAPANLEYDKSRKRYLASQDFRPLFLVPDAAKYLTQLAESHGRGHADDARVGQSVECAGIPHPHRNIDPEGFRLVLSAAREGHAVEVRYQSMSKTRPKPIWRWVSPHAFGYDGMRWHARAFCHIDSKFKDFLLPRILGVRKSAEAKAPGEDDYLWWETISVALKPHPKLTDDQQAVVAQDYGMKKNELHVEVRLALLYYFLRRYGLDFKEAERDPREQHVVLANPDEVRTALDRAQYVEGA